MEAIIGLFGGLALFIFGMQMMSNGLKNAAGDRMQSILERLTSKPVLGVMVGAGVTALIQSSSATTVMVVGFVNAGLMTLRQSIAVIMGANIGTTVTSQLIAFDISNFILPIIIIGFLLNFLASKSSVKYIGSIILGFGILMHGMSIMSGAMTPLRSNVQFTGTMASFADRPFLGLLSGMAVTFVLQSSSAATGILIAMASTGLIDIQGAIPVLFGTNIGTCITAVLSSIGTSRNAKRAALAHVLFNVMGSLIFMILLKPFSSLVINGTDMIVNSFGGEVTVARLVANAHTAFNIINTVLFFPLISFFNKLILRIVPVLEEEKELNKNPIYLDERVLHTPEIASSLARKELVSIGNLASKNLKNAFVGLVDKKPKKLRKVFEVEPIIDKLEKETTVYLTKIAQQNISERLSEENSGLLHVAYDVERIGDHAENIAQTALLYIDGQFKFSDLAIEELKEIYKITHECVLAALKALADSDEESAHTVEYLENAIDNLEKTLREKHIKRLNEGVCFPQSGVAFLDVLSNMERIGDHCSNIAGIIIAHNE
ncbi:Na/Pi cotransporter family protein [Clostridia bacterium]|nr:Na/Pi cotransporter family protein [Clostridia bacterium]